MKLSKNNKKIISSSCKLLLTATLFYILLQYISFTNIREEFNNINILFLVLAFAFTFIQLPLKVLKWVLLVRIHYCNFSFFEAFISYLKGVALATVSPFAVGELARGALIDVEGLNAELTAKTVIDKIFDFSTVLLFSITGICLFFKLYFSALIILFFYLIILFHFTALCSFAYKLIPQSLLSREPVGKFFDGIKNIRRISVFINATISCCYFLIFYFQLFLLLSTFSNNIKIEALTLAPTATLSTIIPLTISGVGIREWTAVMLLQNTGIPENIIFKAFFLQFLITNVLLSVIGGIFFILPKKKVINAE
jgi:uncharacterized protein (TIRG00374 family)